MTGRLSALRWRLLVLQRTMQPRQELSRRLVCVSQPCSVPSQDVAHQCVEVSVVTQSHAECVMNFLSQRHGPSLADPPNIGVEQWLPSDTFIEATDQPRKALGHFRKGFAKAESDDFDTYLEIEGQRIGAWWSSRLLHKYLTSILTELVNTSNNNVVDNMRRQRDIENVNREMCL
jgi:hypothetical protein